LSAAAQAETAVLVARPPAKLNLTLAVDRRGPDGYHSLNSVFLRLGLADRLAASLDPTAAADTLTVDGPPETPVEGNIVLEAAAQIRRLVAQPLPALRIHLVKHVPTAAGLGGGSSDAAAMIGLAEECWGVRLSPEERLRLAGRLGSDVPFFAIDSPAALIEGRGEVVTPLPAVAGGAGLLIATSPMVMRTGAVFARHDELAGNGPGSTARSLTRELALAFEAGLDGAALAQWTDRLRDANDLWAAACSLGPAIGRLRDVLEAASRRPWLLSGSGSALFAIYASTAEAAAMGRSLPQLLPPEFANIGLVVDNLQLPDPEWRYP
jgi:4-diphosphocytidyl-2-C-methyl-D-erythritol kinase